MREALEGGLRGELEAGGDQGATWGCGSGTGESGVTNLRTSAGAGAYTQGPGRAGIKVAGGLGRRSL